MPNSDDLEKIIKTAIKVVAILIVLLLLAYGISKSEFNNIKKYDEPDTTTYKSNQPMSKQKIKFANKRRFSTKVVLNSDKMANLGDFELNIKGNKKLVMNMSLEFKNHKSDSWFNSNDIKKEIIKKGVVLRSTVIDTLSHYDNVNINNPKMQESIIENLNNYLSDGEIKKIYFNKYITHEN